ncbi:hypothetical protein C477_20169 [Haloterrigena salina JCM 13891]|uniref:Uncharacterized protein n=1 Tax=Haloterrigena salina JCM 13891 TaxID=1227488 RepID=M0BTZ9_9EURY|nr:hypothetical protein [Haloterrigena salina]ELZ14491.1 hypothetical protein C477_20169 [Haloterrigena salina JCM 13891]
MREISEIRFKTVGEAENRRLIERYVVDAIDRLPELSCCEYAAFMPVTHEAVDGSNVWLTVAGDSDALVEHESEAWDALVEADLVSEWDVTEVTEDWYETAGEQGGELLLQCHDVANQLTTAAFETFDTRPAPIDTYPNEDSNQPIGWWMVLEIAAGHQEYSFGERAELFLSGLEHTYEDIAELGSPETAAQHIDEGIRALEALRDDLTGEADDG